MARVTVLQSFTAVMTHPLLTGLCRPILILFCYGLSTGKLDMVAYTCNVSTQGTEAGGLMQGVGQPRLYSKTGPEKTRQALDFHGLYLLGWS